MSVSVSTFGFTGAGETVSAYTVSGDGGASVVLLDFGATVQSLLVPNRNGGLTDVVLGYDSVAEYENGTVFLGATIGRFANRIGGARFSLGGKEYLLADNDGGNCLHGGSRGFDKRLWQAEIPDDRSVRFFRRSADGEENFPGNLDVSVTFRLTGPAAALHIEYDASTDADTPVNLTNHSYFDLSGCGRAMEQLLRINAESCLSLGRGTLPDGSMFPVHGTPFDFTSPKPVGRDIGQDSEQLQLGCGYDHNFCLASSHAATLESDVSGVRMDVHTDLPGVQLYSGNFLDGQPGKGGRPMAWRGAVCLETQLWPDAMNHWRFPSPILHAGEKLHSETIYQFHTISL